MNETTPDAGDEPPAEESVPREIRALMYDDAGWPLDWPECD